MIREPQARQTNSVLQPYLKPSGMGETANSSAVGMRGMQKLPSGGDVAQIGARPGGVS